MIKSEVLGVVSSEGCYLLKKKKKKRTQKTPNKNTL